MVQSYSIDGPWEVFRNLDLAVVIKWPLSAIHAYKFVCVATAWVFGLAWAIECLSAKKPPVGVLCSLRKAVSVNSQLVPSCVLDGI